MFALVWTGFWTWSPLKALKYSLSKSNLLFCCFFHPLFLGTWGSVSHFQYFRQRCICPWGHAEKGTGSFGDEERGHMFGTRDNRGEVRKQSPAGCSTIRQVPHLQEKTFIRIHKCTGAYFTTQHKVQCRRVLVSSPCTLWIREDNFILMTLTLNTWIALLNKRRHGSVTERLSSEKGNGRERES